MKPPPFDYHAPRSLDEALALLAQHGDEARPLAGGQSLIPVLNFRLTRPAVLVDLNRVAELAGIADAEGAGLLIGAMTRQRQAERSRRVAERAPLLAEALPHVAHPQIRNRGTVGGSLAHADPASELPAVMLALKASMHLQSQRGERRVPADAFYTGLFATALEPDELLVATEIPPLPPGAGCAFDEVARRHGDYALLGVAAVVTLDEAGACRDVRIAFVNAGGGPVLARRAPEALLGERPTDAALRAAADLAAAEDIRPSADVHATAEFRRQLAKVLTRRVLARAVERAEAGAR
jgi:aerobic carbon-monoxide dehydrogenase medium subunit